MLVSITKNLFRARIVQSLLFRCSDGKPPGGSKELKESGDAMVEREGEVELMEDTY